MAWLVFFALSIFAVSGQDFTQEEPKILTDAEDYDGFPEYFQGLIVTTNNVQGAKYYWEHNRVRIDSEYKPAFRDPASQYLTVSDKSDIRYQGYYQFFMETPAGKISGRNVSVLFTYVGSFVTETGEEEREVTLGQATFLNCPAESSPGRNFIYKWGKTSGAGGTKFVDSSPYYIVLNNGTLFFSHLLKKHVTYINDLRVTCGMEASVGTDNRFKWSGVVKMKVVGENFTSFGPKMVSPLPYKTFELGDTISMKCAATGNPLPKYSWTMTDDKGVESPIEGGKNGVEFEDRTDGLRILVIKAATRYNSGKYKCTATINGTKSDSVEGRLKFEEKPKWADPKIHSVAPSIYSNHTWDCIATGYPEPKYSWYVNVTKLENKPDRHIINGGKIIFPKLLKKDSGMYKCVAENGLDNIYQTAFLDVQAVKPTFKSNSGKKTLFLNNDGIIDCYAYAAPKAVNTWTKDGINIDTSLAKYEVIDNQNLLIKSVTKNDIGNYTCTAANLYGKDAMKIAVQVVGEITFVQEPRSTNVTVGENVNLKCEAKGEELLSTPIKYKWEFKGVELKLDSSNSTALWAETRKTLVILNSKVSDGGVYECIAYIDVPSHAEKRKKATVIVRGPPEPPTSLKVDGGCDGLSAKLTWRAPHNVFDPITSFRIEYQTSYYVAEWTTAEDNVPAGVNEFVVKDLSPYAKYRFRIFAINNIGRSNVDQYTMFGKCITPQRAPTVCPPLTAVAGKANQLSVNWKEMKLIDQNGKNFKFRLQYRKVAVPENPWQSKNFTAVTTNFSIPDAGYYQPWELRLQGVNDAGAGPFCPNRSFSGQDAPSKAPDGFKAKEVRSDYVIVEWKPLIVNPGSIDGYRIRVWQDDGNRVSRSSYDKACESKDKLCKEDNIGPSSSSWRVTGLLAANSYSMELNGYNSGGHGPVSKLNVVTKDGKPSAPTRVIYTPYAKYVEVRWDQPEFPNGIITGYRLYVAGKSYEVSSDKKHFLFSGLEPEKEYTFTIEAKTKQGYGQKTTKVISTKAVMVPAKPSIPFVAGTGLDGVNVTFNKGLPARGFPERFFAVYRVKGSDKEDDLPKSKEQLLFGKEGSPHVVVYGLDRDTEYEFATIAVNYKGQSTRSDFNSTYPGNITPAAQSNPVYKRDWFVAIVVIVCLLLLILLIALLITRKHGERYPVGKREKKRAGILDDAEEAEPESYPMKPPRNAGNGHNRNNSTGSFGNKDPDRDSLDDYGEDKFGEDAASLIGEYNDDHNPAGGAGEGPEFV